MKRFFSGKTTIKIILLVSLLLIGLPLAVILSQKQQIITQHASGGQLFVQGNKLIDPATNKQVILRGVQIPSELNNGWHGGSSSRIVLNPHVFAAIHSWGANTLRLPVAAYEYQQSGYMTFLDQIVKEANQAGLYVIFGNFEDAAAGGGNSILDQQGLQFWKFMAQRYASNPMVLYDIINEPQNTSYPQWLNGGGNAVGMQQVTHDIRTAGGKQVIIAEWIDQGTAGFEGFTSFISDPDIMYSMHMYFKAPNLRTTAGWDSNFGTFAQNHPMLIGEWALLPNANHIAFCQGLDATTGAQLLQSWFTYLDGHEINSVAWAFTVSHLILDETTFAPTKLTDPWGCGNGPTVSHAGMGELLKAYFLSHNATPTPQLTVSPTIPVSSLTPSPTGSISATPTITPTPIASGTAVQLNIFLHGIGLGGDNVNPASTGNKNPVHKQKDITVFVYNINNQVIHTTQGKIDYDTVQGNFKGTIPLQGVKSGDYRLKVYVHGFLRRLSTGFIKFTGGRINDGGSMYLVSGDISTSGQSDNQLDIMDYNALLTCFGIKQFDSACQYAPTQQSTGADLDDNGDVSAIDYNIFLREISAQHGDGNPVISPTPTTIPTVTTIPSITNSPTPTPIPSITPTVIPSSTPTPSPSNTPAPSVTPTPTL